MDRNDETFFKVEGLVKATGLADTAGQLLASCIAVGKLGKM